MESSKIASCQEESEVIAWGEPVRGLSRDKRGSVGCQGSVFQLIREADKVNRRWIEILDEVVVPQESF